MSQFNFFHNDWLDCTNLFQNGKNQHSDLYVNLDADFFLNLNLSPEHFKKYRIETAEMVAKSIGSKIALCFSGGVDSQCMIQSFVEAKIDCDIYALRFNSDLNKQDIEHAIKYCDKHKLKLNIIDIDVLNFLSINNYQYGLDYQSSSPHFNVHYKLFNMLQEKGYDGVVAGGNVPVYLEENNVWGGNYSKNSMNYIQYSTKSGFKCQGNFLSYNPRLCWATALMTPSFEKFDYEKYYTSSFPIAEKVFYENIRYSAKLKGYHKAGFNLLPQKQKYTGFELVKKHLENKTGDGWTFEKLYRLPLEKTITKIHVGPPRFVFKSKVVEDTINSLYRNNLLSFVTSSSGI